MNSFVSILHQRNQAFCGSVFVESEVQLIQRLYFRNTDYHMYESVILRSKVRESAELETSSRLIEV